MSINVESFELEALMLFYLERVERQLASDANSLLSFITRQKKAHVI
jgi:hypothetical protein